MNNSYYHIRLSEAISWLRFPLIFFIIMLHCYSVQRMEGDHNIYFSFLYPFSLWLGETGVPGFFFISGYLFFLSKKSYSQKITTRIHTLLIPYILWNSLLLILYLITYAVGFPQDINGRNIAEYELIDYIRLFWDRGSFDNGNFVPLLCPLWYIRNLLIMSILSPLFYYIIKYLREVFLLFIAIWWMTTYTNAFIPQTILFFCLGAYFSILDKNPLETVIKNKVLFITLFVLFAAGDIITHFAISTPANLQIHRLALIFNIPVLLLLADWCTRHSYSSKTLPNAAFIVFCVHYPIVVILRKLCISTFIYANEFTHIVLYFICVIASTFISLGIFMILERYFPKLKNILSGNR
ncbi:MAG: acyltransferase [Paludibacteraceae bacterium]|nr:acyltransferase [Paludibacteraceae bacterium]